MLRNLLSLVLQGVTRKKHTSILVFCILFLSFALSIVSLSLVGSISKTNAKLRLDNYGAWYYGIPTGKEADAEWLETQSWANIVGVAKNYGDVLNILIHDDETGIIVSDTSMVTSTGFESVDKNYIKLGRLSLDAGRWPENGNEIAIESNALRMMLGADDGQLGAEITIAIAVNGPGNEKIAHKAYTYTLCGVVHDYSTMWSLDQNQERQLLPSFFVTESAAEIVLQECYNSLSASKKYQDISAVRATPEYFIDVSPEQYQQAWDSLAAYLKQTRSDGFGDLRPCTNRNAYPELAETRYDSLYSLLIAGVALVSVLSAYLMQLPMEAKSYATLRSIGITRFQLAQLLLLEALILCIPALLFGIPLGILLTKLSLQLLLYSGSVSVQVSIPIPGLCFLGALWIVIVFLARLITLLVTIHTPLIGKFQMQTDKVRKTKYMRNTLLTVFLVAFGFVVIFTVLDTVPTHSSRQWWLDSPSFSLSCSSKLISDDYLAPISEIPGVKNVYGFSEFKTSISFDDREEEIPVYLYILDAQNWDITFDFGADVESFSNGDICLLCLPDDFLDYELPQNTITIHFMKGSENRVPITSGATAFSLRRIPYNVNNKTLAGVTEPYTIVVSPAYLQNFASNMAAEISWKDFSNKHTGGYHRAHIFASQFSEELCTDVAVSAYCQRNKDVSFYSYQSTRATQIQVETQHLILLYASGGSIALMTLMILGSTSSLETEQEKIRYRTLRIIGMSKYQMWLDIVKKAAFRALYAVLSGWCFNLIYLICWKMPTPDNFENGFQNVRLYLYSSGITMPVIAVLTGFTFVAVLIVSLLSKWKLRKEVDQLCPSFYH